MTNRAQGAGHRTTDAEIDRAIDVVARQMTGGSPRGGADFRRRVLARVASGDAARPAWRAAFVLAPLAVAAAIVLAILVARGFRPHDDPADRGSQAEAVQPTVAQRPAPQPDADAQRTTVRPEPPLDADRGGPENVEGPDTASRAVTNRAATNRAAAAPAPQLDALAAPPLDVARLTVDPLTPDPIQIDRLDAISPIIVAPLDIADGQRRDE